jgi:hypothetical protein
VCDEAVVSSNVHTHHLISNEGDDNPPFTCNICMEQFMVKSACIK